MLATSRPRVFPKEFLNAYRIANFDELKWEVGLYKVMRRDGRPMEHKDRGELKEIFWNYFFSNKPKCKGYRFIADVSADTVIVPATWEIPEEFSCGDHIVRFEDRRTVGLRSADRRLVEALLREGIKGHFKFNRNSSELGDLWQDFGRFCQAPIAEEGDEYCVSRRFDAAISFFLVIIG